MRNLFYYFSYIAWFPACQHQLLSSLIHFVNHLNTKLKAENLSQASNRHVLRVVVRQYDMYLHYITVYVFPKQIHPSSQHQNKSN